MAPGGDQRSAPLALMVTAQHYCAVALCRSILFSQTDIATRRYLLETVLIVSSVLLWIVLICNVLLTLALVRNANKTTAQKELVPAPEGLKEGTQAPSFSAQ